MANHQKIKQKSLLTVLSLEFPSVPTLTWETYNTFRSPKVEKHDSLRFNLSFIWLFKIEYIDGWPSSMEYGFEWSARRLSRARRLQLYLHYTRCTRGTHARNENLIRFGDNMFDYLHLSAGEFLPRRSLSAYYCVDPNHIYYPPGLRCRPRARAGRKWTCKPACTMHEEGRAGPILVGIVMHRHHHDACRA